MGPGKRAQGMRRGAATVLCAWAGAVLLAGAEPWGKTATGETVELFTLKNAKGAEAKITSFGGTLVSLKAPDRKGRPEEITLGFDSPEPYIKGSPFFGSLVGRYGNRIAGGQFTLDGKVHSLPRNNGPNTLHGGTRGFDKVLWTGRELKTPHGQGVELVYVSPDGDQGFPGTLRTKVVYSLNDAGELRIEYEATTDKPTVVNLTNHAYFNLKGAVGGDILGHVLFIDADRITAVGPGLIPTGELKSVAGTPFDFRTATAIGARIDQKDAQLELGGGYDHNYVLNGEAGKLRLVARASEPVSGRALEVLTTEPGIQFYSGNFLDGTVVGRGGQAYKRRSGFCLETQHFPDSPNQPSFPSTVLRPGETYRTTTIYRLTTLP
ncbi:MAG TPA: aldose epimerase family protein [Vicinamibacteria bacterium]